MFSGVLREIDTNRKVTMSVKPQEKNGLKLKKKMDINLPIPFVKGSPVDYQRMTPEQLRLFIPFMFKSLYKRSLPNSSTSCDKPPTWWPRTVTFNKFLTLKASASQKGAQGHHTELSELVRRCYEDAGMATLLALGAALTQSKSGYHIVKLDNDRWKVVDSANRVLVEIDKLSRIYDHTRREQALLENGENNKTVKVSEKPAKTINSSNSEPKSTKRKLEFEGKTAESQSCLCQYCGKEFKYADFRDDHESQCVQGPNIKNQQSQFNFMNALGMLGGSPPPSRPTASSSSSNAPSEPTNARSRSLRKLPKRNHLVTLFRTQPIPITSIRGQKLIKEFGEKVNHSYPPEYEKDCKPRSGLRELEKEYPCVTKRAILKHSDFPHMYSFNRRQRMIRYQELSIGLNRTCWKYLNKIRTAKLILQKLPKSMGAVPLAVGDKRKSYLERTWRPALVPKVRLVDIRKNMTPEASRYLKPADKATLASSNKK